MMAQMGGFWRFALTVEGVGGATAKGVFGKYFYGSVLTLLCAPAGWSATILVRLNGSLGRKVSFALRG
jgi:hypothetical protein